MAATVEAICNSALRKIGAEEIASISDSNKRARLCNTLYPKIRDRLQRSYLWNFCIERAALVESATDPAFEFTNQFDKPVDMLRPLYLYQGGTWREEGDYIVTNDSSANLVYIKQETDPTKFDSMFDEAIAWILASELAYPIVQSITLAQSAAAQANEILMDAKSADAQSGTPQEFNADAWLQSRENFTGATSGSRSYYWGI